MIDLHAIERMLALAEVPPFDLLKESELLLVARQTLQRSFAPGDPVFAAGQVPDFLIAVTSGSALAGGEPCAAVVGAPAILFGLPLDMPVVAGSDGLEALCLAKPHLFTLARECPDFLVGLAALESGDAS